MKLILLRAAVLFAAAAVPAVVLAADLPQKPVTMYTPAPVYSWTGCYAGANIGAAWGRGEISGGQVGVGNSGTNSGVAGGLQVGCDYQIGAFVVGIRNMFDGTSLSSSGTFAAPLAGYSASSKTSWFDTLTGRVGFLPQQNWLLYFQGGAAWIGTDQYVNNPAGAQVSQFSNSTTGWTIGLGTEYMLTPNWSVFVEYNYLKFGTNNGTITAPGTCASGCAVSVKNDSQNVLFGFNYRF